MTEFDKWLEKNEWRNYLYSEEDAAKEGWKAALEWAKSLSTDMIDYGGLINTSEIEWELEEKIK